MVGYKRCVENLEMIRENIDTSSMLCLVPIYESFQEHKNRIDFIDYLIKNKIFGFVIADKFSYAHSPARTTTF